MAAPVPDIMDTPQYISVPNLVEIHSHVSEMTYVISSTCISILRFALKKPHNTSVSRNTGHLIIDMLSFHSCAKNALQYETWGKSMIETDECNLTEPFDIRIEK
jgi:hypothetical protein